MTPEQRERLERNIDGGVWPDARDVRALLDAYDEAQRDAEKYRQMRDKFFAGPESWDDAAMRAEKGTE